MTDPAQPSAPKDRRAGEPASRCVSRMLWEHRFGRMVVETFADGPVWIDGKPVRDTLPAGEKAVPGDEGGDTDSREESRAATAPEGASLRLSTGSPV